MLQFCLFLCIIVLFISWKTCSSYVIQPRMMYSVSRGRSKQLSQDLLSEPVSNAVVDVATNNKIASLIAQHKVLLFMKGNRLQPQCGFSMKACRILDASRTTYETVDVLQDDNIRSGIKAYSDWPTIPQLFIKGEFIGGSDIMIELYESGELANMLKKAHEGHDSTMAST